MPPNSRVRTDGGVTVTAANGRPSTARIRPGSDSDVFYVSIDGVDVALISPRGVTRLEAEDLVGTFAKKTDKNGFLPLQA